MDENGFSNWPMVFGREELGHVVKVDENGNPLPDQYMQSYENVSGYGTEHTPQVHERAASTLFQSNNPPLAMANMYQPCEARPKQTSLPMSSTYLPELNLSPFGYQPLTINPQDLSPLHTSWQLPSMTSSMTSSTTFNEMPDLTSSESTSRSSHNYASAAPSRSIPVTSKSKTRKPLSSRSSSSFSDSPIKKRKSNSRKTSSAKARPRKALAQFENALKSSYPKLSKGFRQHSEILFAQFELLMDKEIADGNLDAEFDEMSLTKSSTQDSAMSSEVLYSGCLTQSGFPASSTPRPQKFDTPDVTPMDVEPEQRVRFYCTFPNCLVPRKDCKCRQKNCKCPRKKERYSSHSKIDLRRHEEGDKHWPQETFVCLECFVIDLNGVPMCPFCFTSLLSDPRTHCLQCELARASVKTFRRKDHLCHHLREVHGMEDMSEQAKAWSYPINSNWPRQCGFCGTYFDTWDQRMEHIGWHFEKGSQIQDWKLPFVRPKDRKPPGPFTNSRKDEDDDDNENGFGGSGGGSGGKVFGNGFSAVTPQITQHGHSFSSEKYGSYLQQGSHQQGYKMGPPNSVLLAEEFIKIFAVKQERWIDATAKLDTGTTENWISASVADSLGLLAEPVPIGTYQPFTGATLRSSTVLRGVTWLAVVKTNTSVADFRIVPKTAPFEVIIGADSIFSKRTDGPVLARYSSTQQKEDRRTTPSQALGRSLKRSIALERYLNDPGDRVPGLWASPHTTNWQLKQTSSRGPPFLAVACPLEASMTPDVKSMKPFGETVVLVHGMPGGGEKILAWRYIYEHWNDMDQGIFWVPYSDNSNQTGGNSENTLFSTPSEGSTRNRNMCFIGKAKIEDISQKSVIPHDPRVVLFNWASEPRTRVPHYQTVASTTTEDFEYQVVQGAMGQGSSIAYASVNQSPQYTSPPMQPSLHNGIDPPWSSIFHRVPEFDSREVAFMPSGEQDPGSLRAGMGSPLEMSYKSPSMSPTRSSSRVPEESHPFTQAKDNGKECARDLQWKNSGVIDNRLQLINQRNYPQASQKRTGVRYGKPLKDVRERAREVRKLGACCVCRFHKRSCSPGELCNSCLRRFPRLVHQVCYRDGLKEYQNAFFPGFLHQHLDQKEIEKFITQHVRSCNADDLVVEISAGKVFKPIKIRVNPFVPSTFAITKHYQLVDGPAGHESQLLERDSARVGILGVSPSGLWSKIMRHMKAMVENQCFTKEITTGDPTILPRRILEVVQKYCSSKEQPLIRNTLMLLAMQYSMGRILTFTEKSAMNLQRELQPYFEDSLPVSMSSRLLNRQVKSSIYMLQRGITGQILERLEESVMSSAKESWGESFCTILVLAVCIENLQTATDIFVNYDITIEGEQSKYRRHHSSDACTNLEEYPFLRIERLFHGAYRSHREESTFQEGGFNPLRAIRDGRASTGLDESTDAMVRAIYAIISDFYPEIMELSTRPAMVNPDGYAAAGEIRANNTGRMVSKFLGSFFDPTGFVFDR